MKGNTMIGQLTKTTVKISPFITTIILARINHTMFLVSTLIFLVPIGMMMTMAWFVIVIMMIRRVKKYGFGAYHAKE